MTLLPAIAATVERRVLLSYRADPEVVARLLPAPFTPPEPAAVQHARSSFFDDPTSFPAGSVTIDSALVMHNIPIEFHGVPPLETSGLPSAA
jgi:hypothetical protein